MSRPFAPVALASGPTPSPSRSHMPRGHTLRRRAPTFEQLSPHDVGLGTLFVHTHEAIIVGNVESGSIALWNPAAERLFGWTADEAIGQPIEILIPIPIVRLHQAGMSLFRRTGHGNLVDSGAPVEVPALTRDGEEVRVELRLVALQHGDVSGKYVMALLRDVSERRRADMQALEAARADAARAALEQLIADDVRAVQSGAADVERELNRAQRASRRLARAVRNGELDAERLRRITRVSELRSDRARRALDEVVTCAALRGAVAPIEAERVNLVPLVSRVIAEVRAAATPCSDDASATSTALPSHAASPDHCNASADQTGASPDRVATSAHRPAASPNRSAGSACRVSVALPQGLTAVVDARLIETLVRTLVDRAMRRNPRGCWVDVDLRRPLAGQARLEVREVGHPVSARTRVQLSPSEHEERGMALCRLIVKRHGGGLTVDFPADGGIRVVATLPTQHSRAAAS